MRDGREETQRFPMESCRSFTSLPCFKRFYLELWVAGNTHAPQPCGERRAPTLLEHPLCYRQRSSDGARARPHHSPAPTPHLRSVPHSHPPPLPARRRHVFVSLGRRCERTAVGLRRGSSEIAWCWNKLQASVCGPQVALKGERRKRRNKLVSLLILCCGYKPDLVCCCF